MWTGLMVVDVAEFDAWRGIDGGRLAMTLFQRKEDDADEDEQKQHADDNTWLT